MATAEKKPASRDEKQQQNGEVDTAAQASEQLGIEVAGRALLARALPGPEGHPGLGARVRRADGAPRGARVGREGGVPLAGRAGGGQDRALRLRVDRAVLGRPVRAHLPDRQRGALLGRRRDRHVDLRHDAGGRRASTARARPSSWSSGCRSASATEDDVKVGAFCASEPDAGSDVSGYRTTAKYDEAQGRVGHQRPEGLGDQRRHRQRPRGDRLGRPRARLARPRRLRHPARAPRASSRAPR